MASITVSPAQDALTGEIFIAAPPERVFQALVDPSQVLRWWGQTGIYRCTDFQSDLRPGGKWRNAGVSADGYFLRLLVFSDPATRYTALWAVLLFGPLYLGCKYLYLLKRAQLGKTH